MAKADDVIYATPSDFGTLRSEAESFYHVVKLAMKECCSVWNAAFSELEDQYELQNGSALSGQISVLLADPPYSTRSARGHVTSAHNVFSRNSIEYAVSFMSSGMALGARGHTFCSDLTFCHWG